MKLDGFSRGSAFIALVLAVGFSVYAFRAGLPPKALPDNIPDDAFSALRAYSHVHTIASEPHEAGTAALEEVRDYLVETLTGYGLDVDVDNRLVVEAHWVREIDTVLARIPGTDNKHPFMLTAHYDSAVNSLGAADDGAGVVTMLELARALMAGDERFENDIVFVFTSDEERAQRSIRTSVEHPWLENMLGVVGFEARGYYGPAYMFETSPGNAFLIRELQKLGAPTVGNSLMFSVYDRAPLGTDFGAIKRMGYQGYNLAFVGGLYYYHTLNDSPDNLDPDTLQHMGDYGMAFVRHFGNWSEPWPEDEPDAVFFNTVGYHLVTYPMHWSLGIAAAALTVLLIGLGLGWRRDLIGAGRTALALFHLVLVIGLGAALTAALTYGTYQLLYVYLMYNVAYYQFASFLLGAGVFFLLSALMLRRCRAAEIYSAALVFWAVALCIVQWYVPSASHIPAWTLNFGAAGLVLWALVHRTRAGAALGPWCMLPGVLTASAFAVTGIYSLYLMGASLSLPAVAALALALLALFAPLVLAVLATGRAKLGTALLAAGLAVWVYGITQNGFSPAKPQVVSLSYALNQATGQAGWFSSDAEPNAWTRGFLGDAPATEPLSAVLEQRRGRGLHAPAPVVSLPGPELTLIAEREDEGLRHLTLHYVSPGKAHDSFLMVLEPSAVRRASVEGEPLLDGGPLWRLGMPVMPRSGELRLEIAVDAGEDVRILVEEEFFGLPEAVTRQGGGPMYDWMVPKSNTLGWWEQNPIGSNRLWIQNQFSFPATAEEEPAEEAPAMEPEATEEAPTVEPEATEEALEPEMPDATEEAAVEEAPTVEPEAAEEAAEPETPEAPEAPAEDLAETPVDEAAEDDAEEVAENLADETPESPSTEAAEDNAEEVAEDLADETPEAPGTEEPLEMIGDV